MCRWCTMPCWRMPVVSKEQECLQWTALAGMLGICLIVSPSPITGFLFFLFFYMHILVGTVFVGKYEKMTGRHPFPSRHQRDIKRGVLVWHRKERQKNVLLTDIGLWIQPYRVFIGLHLINASQCSTLFPCNHVCMHGLFNKIFPIKSVKLCYDWTHWSLFILWQNSSSINHHWIDRDYLWSFSTGRLITGEQSV